jgi:hypothetical protein
VRTDIPLAQQLVQVGHACLEAGRHFAQPSHPCHLVLLSVKSQAQLHDAVREAEAVGVRSLMFYEPDDELGDTAACTEPLVGPQRPIFRRFALWEAVAPSRAAPDPQPY